VCERERERSAERETRAAESVCKRERSAERETRAAESVCKRERSAEGVQQNGRERAAERCDMFFMFKKKKLACVTSGGSAFHNDMALYITARLITSVFGLGTVKKPIVVRLVGYVCMSV
jgi:hypothetical protein